MTHAYINHVSHDAFADETIVYVSPRENEEANILLTFSFADAETTFTCKVESLVENATQTYATSNAMTLAARVLCALEGATTADDDIACVPQCEMPIAFYL